MYFISSSCVPSAIAALARLSPPLFVDKAFFLVPQYTNQTETDISDGALLSGADCVQTSKKAAAATRRVTRLVDVGPEGLVTRRFRPKPVEFVKQHKSPLFADGRKWLEAGGVTRAREAIAPSAAQTGNWQAKFRVGKEGGGVDCVLGIYASSTDAAQEFARYVTHAQHISQQLLRAGSAATELTSGMVVYVNTGSSSNRSRKFNSDSITSKFDRDTGRGVNRGLQDACAVGNERYR